MFEVAQARISWLRDYLIMSNCSTWIYMNPAILAASLILSRLHGTTFAALFLLDEGIAFEVIAELLLDAPSRRRRRNRCGVAG
jgi:hypothetical protein